MFLVSEMVENISLKYYPAEFQMHEFKYNT